MRKSFALISALLISGPQMAAASLRISPDRLDRAAISLGRQAKVSIGISEPGLALVRAIARRHGLEIYCRDAKPGTEFLVERERPE